MSEKQPGSANEPLPNNSKENSNEKTRDTFQIKIEGKNFEVVKTHFTYPEAIIEENGGVEGYDRFELSWKDFNETTKDSNLNEIAEKLGIGTEQKESTISHYVNAVDGKKNYEWNDNRFFLNKPFDIKDVLNHFREYKKSPTTSLRYGFINRKMENFVLMDELKRIGFSEEALKDLYVTKDNTLHFEREDVQKVISENPDFIDSLEEIIKDNDIILSASGAGGMSFAQGSQLSSESGILGSSANHEIYASAFFNFNNRNSAFANYVKNLESYKEKFGEKIGGDIAMQDKGTHINHPQFSMVFTKDFPAFRWCFADTAYVPMKEGPNFFRFYSRETEEVQSD